MKILSLNNGSGARLGFVQRRFGSAVTIIGWHNRYHSCCEEGAISVLCEVTRPLTVWKRVHRLRGSGYTTIPLLLPAGTIFWTHSGIAKCRANMAISMGSGASNHNSDFIYERGAIVFPARSTLCHRKTGFGVRAYSVTLPGPLTGKSLREWLQINAACSAGIHFFATRRQAARYDFT